jgi:hypothetical protein
MWTVGWERGERGGRGKSQGVGQLLPDQRQGWMGICHYEQKAGSPSNMGLLY